MSRDHYFYTRLKVKDLELIIKDFQEKFDEDLQNTFSDDELRTFEQKIDEMAAIFVQPVIEDLSFDDFYTNPITEQEQRKFFDECRSSISVENLPYMESNPFQISYLKDLLTKFDQVLIDSGSINPLQFKDEYLLNLRRYKDMNSIVPEIVPRIIKTTKSSMPVHPIDFLVRDVYAEMVSSKSTDRMKNVVEELRSMPQAINIIFDVMNEEGLDAEVLMLKSKLNAKDFGDQLERLKFFLRRINRA